ncbi:MAG: hypothetical protein NUV82_04295 [Candidatus Komeilibacteria bacterium]|nr:hypothetical protein [Candidatus Komeilibacteria bacterium]
MPKPTIDIRKTLGSDQPSRMARPAATKSTRGLWIGGAVLLVALALTIYFAFDNTRGENSLVLAVTAPAEVTAGESFSYKISYSNTDDAALTNLELSLQFPANFIWESASLTPTNEGRNFYRLPDLPAGQTQELIVTGYLSGEKSQNATLNAKLVYEPANFSSEFSAQTSFTQIIKEVAVDMWIDAPTEVTASQPVIFKIHILPRAEWLQEPLRLEWQKAERLSFVISEPTPTNDNVWWIDQYKVGEEIVITIQSDLPPALEDSITLANSFRLWLQTPEPKMLDEDAVNLQAVNPQLKVGLKLADEKQTQSVNWGETVNYELTVTNQGEYEPTDMRIVLTLNTDFINWQTWQDSAGLKREGNKIIWTRDNPQIGKKLEKLVAGEEIKIRIGAKLQDAPIDSNTLSPQSLRLAAAAKIEVPLGSDTYVAASDIVVTNISQGIEFSATAAPAGDGPTPPQVGQETVYLINWSLSTALTALEGIKIETTMPPYVEWRGMVGGTAPVVDSATKRITINLSELTAGGQTSGSFKVGVTPGDEDSLTLLNPWTMTATKGTLPVSQQFNATKP